jgi:hypothetical protein
LGNGAISIMENAKIVGFNSALGEIASIMLFNFYIILMFWASLPTIPASVQPEWSKKTNGIIT